MNTAVHVLYEPGRRRTWVVRWYSQPDPVTGRQRRKGRLFRYCRDAKAFAATKQSEIDRGASLDPPKHVTLEHLLAEFDEARLPALSYASQCGYRHTMKQLREYFGPKRKLREIQQRQAEAFMATRKRTDGRHGDLVGWSKARHLIHC